MITTPILLITFNRPNHTRRVLERILEAQPTNLYIFQDGARSLSPQPLSPAGQGTIAEHPDVEKCQQVRDVISSLTLTFPNTIVHTNYSRVNLGCGAGPMTALNWFFDQVEQGVVMEDDCLAHPDFFPYCEELLDRYKGTDVKFINATLYNDRWSKALDPDTTHHTLDAKHHTLDTRHQTLDTTHQTLDTRHQTPDTTHQSYAFSHYMVTGAWASYREVWQGFDLDLKSLNVWAFAKQVYHMTHNLAEAEWWWYQVRAIQQDTSKKSYWDYQMQIHLFCQGALTIHPAVNLISNIGFDPEGTHTKSDDGRGDKAYYGILPLMHPTKMSVLDNRLDVSCFGKKQSQGIIKDLLMCLVHIYTWRNKKWV